MYPPSFPSPSIRFILLLEHILTLGYLLSLFLRTTNLPSQIPEIYHHSAIIVILHHPSSPAISHVPGYEAVYVGGGEMYWCCDGEWMVPFCETENTD